MRELYAQIERAAAAPVDVLIRGETGTGKELIARELHRCVRGPPGRLSR
jgi:DNA-binding NtrC family response regulator